MSLNVKNTYNKHHPLQPLHDMVKYHSFNINEELECHLLDALARVADKNNIDINHLNHLFPAILRMLKSDSEWAK